MFHLHCGDTSADALRKSGVSGEIAVWSDTLWEGPTVSAVSFQEWNELRGAFHSSRTRGQLKYEDVVQRMADQERALERYRQHDETVLWFDACMFDQTIMVRQLDWFAKTDTPPQTLSLICVGEFPGFEKFTGLGELSPKQLRSLLDKRKVLETSDFAIAKACWAAFCSSDPTGIERLLVSDTTRFPYLKACLQRRLQEFPSMHNGLSRLQQEILEAVGSGAHRLMQIFVAASAKEEFPFFGDTTVYAFIDDLATAKIPALTVSGPDTLPLWNPPENMSAYHIEITPLGEMLLAGKDNWIERNGIDRWVGGTHLKAEGGEELGAWRWNANTEKLVLAGNNS